MEPKEWVKWFGGKTPKEISWGDSGKSFFRIDFIDEESYRTAKAMIEFCTNYESELFEMFYKWFKKGRKED